jgi:hypothetical protein
VYSPYLLLIPLGIASTTKTPSPLKMSFVLHPSTAPPTSLLVPKSRPTHPLPPSKLRGASPSISTSISNKLNSAPSTGSSLTSFPASGEDDKRKKRDVVVVVDGELVRGVWGSQDVFTLFGVETLKSS